MTAQQSDEREDVLCAGIPRGVDRRATDEIDCALVVVGVQSRERRLAKTGTAMIGRQQLEARLLDQDPPAHSIVEPVKLAALVGVMPDGGTNGALDAQVCERASRRTALVSATLKVGSA